MEGRKDDQGKVRLELVPPDVLWCLAKVLTFGAAKYEDRNWEKGMKWSRVYGALLRHLILWWGGVEKDKETGYPHLWHALCCLVFLVAYQNRAVGEDDRPHNDLI